MKKTKRFDVKVNRHGEVTGVEAYAAPLATGPRKYVAKNALPYPIWSFQGRTLDLSRPVEVYRNLTRGGKGDKTAWYSIRQDGQVVGHARGVMIQDATFIVHEAGRKRVLATGRKNVHAFVRGKLVGSGCGTCLDRESLGFKVRYNPRVAAFFFWGREDDIDPPVPARKLRGAMMVMIRADGMTASYTH